MTIRNHHVLYRDDTDQEPMIMLWDGCPLSAALVVLFTLCLIAWI